MGIETSINHNNFPLMKKIFLETHNLKNLYSGLGQFNFNLIKEFNKKSISNLELIVLTKKKDIFPKLQSFIKFKKYFSFQRNFPILSKHDVWHSMNQNSKIEPFFVAKYVLTIHDINFVYEQSSEVNHPRNKRFIKKLKKASAITYVSEYTKSQTHHYFQVPKVPEFVIYNGNSVLPSQVEEVKAHHESIPYYYSIGDFLERKNFHKLVQMMTFIKDRKLIISGSLKKSYSKKVIEEIQKNKLEGQVILTDKVSDEEKLAYMKGCEAFLFPSENEGFGLPPIEAMAFGKPVFLYHHASLPEIGGDAAFYWENLDAAYMANKLLTSMHIFRSNPQEFENKLKERANFFSWSRAADEYLVVYQKLLEK